VLFAPAPTPAEQVAVAETAQVVTKESEPETISLGDLADAYNKEKAGKWSEASKSDWETIRKVYFRFVGPSAQVHTIIRRVFHEYRELFR